MSKLILLSVVIGIMVFSACKKDKPKTLPVITTTSATDITTNSAKAGGKITNAGNAAITERGIVYSTLVTNPTVSDDKKVAVTADNEFTVLLENLNSGKTYHIRAYAINEVGTAYGDVVDFNTGNAAPTVSNVIVSGSLEVNQKLSAIYTYNDAENDSEGATTFQWYVADNSTGSNEIAISGATDSTFVVQEVQLDKFIRVGVTPKATAGTTTGMEVKSSFQTAIGEATTVTFTYNGSSVTYGIITSATTQKKWLDRNLGAPNTPISATDYANYGDLFQWGRAADGHQIIQRNGPNDGDMVGVNGITSTVAPFEYSSTVSPAHKKFIVIDGANGPYDWLSNGDNNLWQGVAGVNNPCPSGWRLPTQDEWSAEGAAFGTTLDEAYSALKITYTGGRDAGNGDFFQTATLASYWSSSTWSVIPSWAVQARVITGVGIDFTFTPARANGFAVRCIKD